MFDENSLIEQIKFELKNGPPSTVLVSGYRGAGKTSLFNKISEDLKGEMVFVNLNLAKYDGYPNTLKKLIRQLHLQYKVVGSSHEEGAKSERENLRLLYDRTFNDIVDRKFQSSKSKVVHKFSANINLIKFFCLLGVILCSINFSIGPFNLRGLGVGILFVCALVAYFSDVKYDVENEKSDENEKDREIKSLYDDDIAEYRLIETLVAFRGKGVSFVISFDEIDKIEGSDNVDKVLHDLKSLLLSGHASFFVIAGQDTYYNYQSSIQQDDKVIGSLFSKHVHVSLLKITTLRRYCRSLMNEPEQALDSRIVDFFDAMILESGRIPRKLVNIIRRHLTWDNTGAYIEIADDGGSDFKRQANILIALADISDNQLPKITRNPVMLDFFISQLHLWVAKMIDVGKGAIEMDKIIDLGTYRNIYPSGYAEVLPELSEMLIDTFFNQGLIEVLSTEDESQTSYFWQEQISQKHVDSGEPFNAETISDSSLDNQEGQPLSMPDFVVDFTDLERFIYDLYHELHQEQDLRPRDLMYYISALANKKALSERWRDSERIKDLSAVRDKMVHHRRLDTRDMETIKGASFTMARLKGEAISDYCFYVASQSLEKNDYSIQRKNRIGFDFIANKGDHSLLFDVKILHSGVVEVGEEEQILNKYGSFQSLTSTVCEYIVIYFYPGRRKSLPGFFHRFDAFFKHDTHNIKGRIHLFYLSESDQGKYKRRIEGFVEQIRAEIESVPVATYFSQQEINLAKEKIRMISEQKYADDETRKQSYFHQQIQAIEVLQSLRVPNEDYTAFSIFANNAKSKYPDDYEQQLRRFEMDMERYREDTYFKPDNGVSGEIPSEIIEKIKVNAERQWPARLEQQKKEVQSQMEAYILLHQPKPKHMSEHNFAEIQMLGRELYPDDYVMQLEWRINRLKLMGLSHDYNRES